MSNKFATRFHSEPAAAVIPGLTRNLPCTRDAEALGFLEKTLEIHGFMGHN